MFTLFRCPQTRTRTPPTPTRTPTHFHASTLPLPLACRRVRRDPHELVASSLIVGHNAAALTAALSTAAHSFDWHIPSFGSLLTLRSASPHWFMIGALSRDKTTQHNGCARCVCWCTVHVLCCSQRVLAKYSTVDWVQYWQSTRSLNRRSVNPVRQKAEAVGAQVVDCSN